MYSMRVSLVRYFYLQKKKKKKSREFEKTYESCKKMFNQT